MVGTQSLEEATSYCHETKNKQESKKTNELEINLDFQDNFVIWKETKIPMISINYKMRTNFSFQ